MSGERRPSQTDRVLADLRRGGGSWVCAIRWVRGVPAILRYGARVWELRHRAGHEIEERLCVEHHVAEYRLAYDSVWDREPV